MKLTLLRVVTALLALPVVVVAEPTTLNCSVELTQGPMLSARTLVPRSASGRKFASFSLKLDGDPKDAWEHQNMCVTKRDFRGASFEGPLCIVLVTAPESAEDGSPSALFIDVGRDASTGQLMPLPGVRRDSLGGVNAVIPLDRSGRKFTYSQSFATKGTKGELSRLQIECSPSLAQK